MERIDVDLAHRRVTLGPDRQIAALIAFLMAVYSAVLLTIRSADLMTFGPKHYIVLGVSLLAPLGMLLQAGRRSHRVEGRRLFVSGLFGIGWASYDLAGAQVDLTHVFVVGQSSYRLGWTFPDGQERVMCTWVANRHPLLDVLRRWMTDATPGANDELLELSRREGVRHVDDDAYGRGPLPSDAFRMVEIPAHGVTIVVGNLAWVVRDGVVLTAGADPIVVIEAGPLLLFLLQSASEEEVGSLAAFGPHHVPRECEVIDDSGSAMNVRAGPRGNATVITSVPAGTRVTANDMSGSWFHVATSPPGWAHQRGLRCDPLEVALY